MLQHRRNLWMAGVTCAAPLSVRGVSQVSRALAVEFRHEGAVRVSDQQDGRVEHLDLFLTALVGLHTDAAAAPPVVLLALKTWFPGSNVDMHLKLQRLQKCCRFDGWVLSTSVEQGAVEVEAAGVVPSYQLDQVTDPSVSCAGETGERHQGGGSVR